MYQINGQSLIHNNYFFFFLATIYLVMFDTANNIDILQHLSNKIFTYWKMTV